MASIVTSPPPRGFTVTTAPDGPLVVRYRDPSGWGFVVMPALVVILSVGFTLGVILDSGQEDRVALMLGAILFWIAAIAYTRQELRKGFMTTEFVMAPERLTVTQQFLGRPRTWQLERAWLREVVQIEVVQDESPDEWHLTIQPQGGKPETVLATIERDASDWLGPVIAQWAGVPFIPVPPPAPTPGGRRSWWRFWEWRWEWEW